jgi:hypothetical protein
MLLWVGLAAPAVAGPPRCDPDPGRYGVREQYLVTVAPGDAPFSYLGHTGLWIRDKERGIDHVIEFGEVDARQDPASALLLGTLRSRWRVRPISEEVRSYVRSGRRATASRIELSPAVEQRLLTGVYGAAETAGEAASPFHWRERSCATAVRGLVDGALGGALAQALSTPAPLSPREEVVRHLARVPWAAVGWTLLAGTPADAPQSRYDAAFTPVRLQEALDEQVLGWPDGSTRPLLAPPCLLNGAVDTAPPPEPPDASLPAGLVGLGLGLGLGLLGWRRPRAAGVVVAAAGVVGGALASVALGLALASELSVLRPNRNWLFLHPLLLALVPMGVAWARGRRPAWGWPVAAGLAGLAIVGLPLALVPAWPQGDHVAFLLVVLPGLLATAWLAARRRPDGRAPPR